MQSFPPIKLSVLRDIGWKEWDPIGILPEGRNWDHEPFANEYDSYLLEVAGAFRRGASLTEATSYLAHIEREHMGLSNQTDRLARAEATARLIQQYMLELDRQT